MYHCIFGHIHQNFDFITNNGTRLVGNQYGKPKDNIDDYSKEFVVKIKSNTSINESNEYNDECDKYKNIEEMLNKILENKILV